MGGYGKPAPHSYRKMGEGTSTSLGSTFTNSAQRKETRQLMGREPRNMTPELALRDNLMNMIQDKISGFRGDETLIPTESNEGKELVLSMKINFWLHEDPLQIKITQFDPILVGT